MVCPKCGGSGKQQIVKERAACKNCIDYDSGRRVTTFNSLPWGRGYTLNTCPVCHGSGKYKGKADCTRCRGKGTVRVKCSHCLGKGYNVVTEIVNCKNCGGKGEV